MNITQAQQKALDDALVAHADRLEFRKCNKRLNRDIKPIEATFQVVLDALALTRFYRAFLITADIPAIYMQEFWTIVSMHKSSIRFVINKKKVSLDVDMFREILQFCPKILGQKFEDLPLEQDILSFIKDLGHTGDIAYLTDVNVDYLYQPWRAFSTGMFHKKNIDYVYLLWEDFLFQIENKDAKKTNKMSYPRFTKITIDYFMSKDQSISRRNNMFWHTARDDTMFTSMRCISRHEDTQVYGTILTKELTNQAMLESNAYKTYYAFASGEKTPKPKYIRKKADSNTSPKQKPVQATEGTRIKSKAKVSKSDKKKQPAKKPKAKGLVVLSEVPDEQHLKTTGADEGTGTIPGVPDVPIYESESEKETWGDSEDEDKDNENDSDDLSNEGDDDNNGNNGNDDDDDANDDDKQEGDDTIDDDEETDSDRTELDLIMIPIFDQSTTEYYEEEDEKTDDEETMYDDEDDEVTKELAPKQQNVSQESGFEQLEEDAHVTLTLVLDTQKANEVQCSSVSSNFTGKLLNLENPSPIDNKIASMMETSTRHATTFLENTSGFTTTTPPPPSFNDRVTNLEKDLSEITQVDQYAHALSSIPAIVDRYMDNKLGEAINKAILAHNLDCRQEAQDEKNAYIELVDMSMRALIKEEVNTQLP
ncbi:hypothetical protein Tco_0634014 [Tanacetum coccineum]